MGKQALQSENWKQPFLWWGRSVCVWRSQGGGDALRCRKFPTQPSIEEQTPAWAAERLLTQSASGTAPCWALQSPCRALFSKHLRAKKLVHVMFLFLCFSPRTPAFGCRVWEENTWQQEVIKKFILHLDLRVFSGLLIHSIPHLQFWQWSQKWFASEILPLNRNIKLRIDFLSMFPFLLSLLGNICRCQCRASLSVIPRVKNARKLSVEQISFYRHNFIFHTFHQIYPIQYVTESLECMNASKSLKNKPTKYWHLLIRRILKIFVQPRKPEITTWNTNLPLRYSRHPNSYQNLSVVCSLGLVICSTSYSSNE